MSEYVDLWSSHPCRWEAWEAVWARAVWLLCGEIISSTLRGPVGDRSGHSNFMFRISTPLEQ